MTFVCWAQIHVAHTAYWYLLPLVAVVSLVYSATRHEEWFLIWRRALRLGLLILGFMGLALGVLLLIQLL